MIVKKVKSLIRKSLNRIGFYRKWQLSKNALNFEFIYILLFTQKNKNIKIIQIGANHGMDLLNKFNNDHRNKISYIGIEPQEVPFNQLKQTYKGFKNFNLIKECVGKKGKNNFFYLNKNYEEYCKKNNIDFLYNGYGGNSLIKENISKRLINNNLNPDTYISNYEIEVNPLYDVLKKHNLDCEHYKNIDLLQIDTEGYDDETIYNSNLEFFKPKYINFEYHNLSKNKLENLIKFLNEKSYEFIKYKPNDCLAVLRE